MKGWAWFDGVPTGSTLAVPFDEPAFLLVFRGQKPELDQVSFVERFKPDNPPRLLDLPADHPARAFARQVNPRFG